MRVAVFMLMPTINPWSSIARAMDESRPGSAPRSRTFPLRQRTAPGRQGQVSHCNTLQFATSHRPLARTCFLNTRSLQGDGSSSTNAASAEAWAENGYRRLG
jgi:hypothetical protein